MKVTPFATHLGKIFFYFNIIEIFTLHKIHPSNVYNSIVFSIFTELYKYHHDPILEHFHHSKKNHEIFRITLASKREQLEGPTVVQWVKDLALPPWWCRCQVWLTFHPWPVNFHMLQVWPKRERERKKSSSHKTFI